jgi:alkaline phosphatase
MRVLVLFAITLLVTGVSFGQKYSSQSVFSHNDYEQRVPFHLAYGQRVGFIEADIFLHNGRLVVAHDAHKLAIAPLLTDVYLNPLREKVERNHGFAYPDSSLSLVLMIDVKSEAEPALKALVSLLKDFPSLTECRRMKIVISGNRPDVNTWASCPRYIEFDGRPDEFYSDEQLAKVAFISDSFRRYSAWNGKGVLTKEESGKIKKVIDGARLRKKPLRFWATPDELNAWIRLMDIGVDILNTDTPTQLVELIGKMKYTSWKSGEVHQVYKPEYEIGKWKRRPKNIILLVGDGMGLAQLYAGWTANRGSLNTFEIRDVGLSITNSSDSYITDSAAGATAMASGTKTHNRAVGVDSLDNPTKSIVHLLKEKGYCTSIISMGDVTDATPAAFYAHQTDRSMADRIAGDFLKNPSDILVGGGSIHFKGSVEAQSSSLPRTKFVLNDDSVVSKIRGRQNFLESGLKMSLKECSQRRRPFFIMAEGAQIDHGGHNNNLEYVVREVIDFDQAVKRALEFADKNRETLVIVTADHETGGLTLIGGDINSGYVHGNFSSTDHTGVPVPVFAYGPGSDLFRGVYQNTEIFYRVLKALQFERHN